MARGLPLRATLTLPAGRGGRRLAAKLTTHVTPRSGAFPSPPRGEGQGGAAPAARKP